MLARFCNYRTILRFDLMTGWVAVHALVRLVSLRIRHGRGDSGVTVSFHFALHIFNQLVVVVSREPVLHVDEVILKAGDGIASMPVLEETGRYILRGIVDSVAFHTHHLGFDQGRAFAPMGAFTR